MRGKHTEAEKKKIVLEIRRMNKAVNGKKGTPIAKACKKLRIPVPTFYFWASKLKPAAKTTGARR